MPKWHKTKWSVAELFSRINKLICIPQMKSGERLGLRILKIFMGNIDS